MKIKEYIENEGMDWNEIVGWKNYTSHNIIEGHGGGGGLILNKLRRSLYFGALEGEVNGRGTSESPPKAEVFENKQRLLKKEYETKSDLLEGRWIFQKNNQFLNQVSF